MSGHHRAWSARAQRVGVVTRRAGAVSRQTLAAIRYVDETVPDGVPEGIVLRYGLFYGHGASNGTLSAVRAGKFPVIGGGTGIWSCWNPCRRRSGPCSGRDRVARFLAGLIRRIRNLEASFRIVEANGRPGAVTYDRDGHVVNVFALDIADGAVSAMMGSCELTQTTSRCCRRRPRTKPASAGVRIPSRAMTSGCAGTARRTGTSDSRHP